MKRKRKEKKRLKKYQNKNKISFGDDEEVEDVAPKVKYYLILGDFFKIETLRKNDSEKI